MFKIKDVFQIRNIERYIRRPLTEEELQQIDDGESLILETPSGGFRIEHVNTYSIRDLVEENIDWSKTEQWDKDEVASRYRDTSNRNPKVFSSLITSKELTANKAVLNFCKTHGIENIEDQHGNIKRQVFTQPKLEQEKYFHNLEMALLALSNEKNELFDDPTDAFIMDLHCFDGLSDVEISKRLLAEQNSSLKPLGQKAVSCRRLKVLKRLDIEPYIFRK